MTGSDIDGDSGSTGPFYIGQVSSTVPAAVANGDSSSSTDTATADQNPTSSFQLVDSQGNPVTLSTVGTGSLSSVSISVAGPSQATDPLYDAYDPTTGGGDSGAILLSPYIAGGTVSNDLLQPLQPAAQHRGHLRLKDGSALRPATPVQARFR